MGIGTYNKMGSKEIKLRKLDPHQRKALRFIRQHDGQAGVFMAPGTGKTLVGIRYGRWYIPALLVCRRDDFMTWRDELEADGHDLSKVKCLEDGDIDLKQIKRDIESGKIRWLMVTYDLCKNPRVMRLILKVEWGICILDESHSIKRYKSTRTKIVIRATRKIDRRLALTGSPITNEPRDIFSQALFIDNGKVFGNKEYWFNKRYYIKSGFGWYLKKGAKKAISEKLKKISFHVHEDDVLKLPRKRRVTKAVPMTKQQIKWYDQILNEWEYEIEDGKVIEIDQAIVKIQKLRQISGGFIYDEDGNPKWLDSAKLKLLKSMLKDPDELGRKSKIVIWCAYSAEIEAIAKMAKELKIKHVTFYGSNRKKKNQARKDFRDKPEIRLFIGQVDSGVGMNELKVSDSGVYYSNSTKVVSRQQSERRIRRRGSEIHDVITYWDLIAEGSMDVVMRKSIGASMDLAQYILDEIKQGRKIINLIKGARGI